jgi:hypothetical protein
MARSRVRESTADIAEQIEAAIRKQEAEQIEEAVDERVEEMRDYAVSISPEDSGEYKESFRIDRGRRDGLPTRTLKNVDPIANLVEYGSIHNPEFAVLGRTAHQFGGTTDK